MISEDEEFLNRLSKLKVLEFKIPEVCDFEVEFSEIYDAQEFLKTKGTFFKITP